jgi:hypothetical protein
MPEPRWTFLVGRVTALGILLCFFFVPWTQMNGISYRHEAFYFLGSEAKALERTFGIPRDVSALHIRCLLCTLLSVPTLAVAVLLTHPRVKRPWALSFATLLAGSVLALLIRYQRHSQPNSTDRPWYGVDRSEASSLLAFVPPLVGLVVATLVFLDVTPRRVLFARLIAVLCALSALALPGQTARATYIFDWGARLMGLAAALLVVVESSRVSRTPEGAEPA